MKQFDFYEFAGILMPGALLLIGIVYLWPEAAKVDGFKDISVGALGIFTLLAYATGHLIQSVGNALEWFWWKAFGGIPSDWPRSGKRELISAAQQEKLITTVRKRLGLNLPDEVSKLSANEWYGITRQIYADVAAANRAARIDVFNGNYGLNRGLASALIVVAVLSPFSEQADSKITAMLFVFTLLACLRMHRFAKHYARELFVQFLQLPEAMPKEQKL